MATDVGERFTLELPADPAFVSTARIFASELARQLGADVEILDDLKVAVSEACTRALKSSGAEGELKVKAHRHGDRLVFEIPQGEAAPIAGASATDELTAALSLELIAVLFDDSELVQEDDGTSVVRFSVPTG